MRRATIQRFAGTAGILVLGSNLWASLVLIPALHLSAAERSLPLKLTVALPPLVLVLGLVLRSRAALLGGFLIALLAPLLAQPRLVGGGVFRAGSFALLAFAGVAYAVGAALLLQRAAAPPRAAELRPLRDAPPIELGRVRRRVFRGLAILAALFPAVLVAALFIDPLAGDALRSQFPERAPEALALFGTLALGLWLLLFARFFRRPLAAQVRDDRALRSELAALGHAARGPAPRARFYAWVAVALAAMAALLFGR